MTLALPASGVLVGSGKFRSFLPSTSEVVARLSSRVLERAGLFVDLALYREVFLAFFPMSATYGGASAKARMLAVSCAHVAGKFISHASASCLNYGWAGIWILPAPR